ncbi:MAG TPA: DUF6249 domain-containing protein [Bacteroidales bacterium]|nr:DUF6249 domain-containing protein [Bacteroidales bacterium]
MSEELVYNIVELVMPFLGIGLSFMVLYIIFYAIKAENRAKMALIEKGMDPSLASKKHRPNRGPSHLKTGLFLIGLALGILMGYVLYISTEMNEWVTYPSMILLFGGISLTSYHAIERQRDEFVNP